MPSEIKQGDVPSEIKLRLDNKVFLKRIEHSRYGAIDRLLNIIFWQKKWMIKPQAPIFEEASTMEEEEPDTSLDAGDISWTSYGKVKAKGARATHPDFIVCSFTPTGLDDVPCLVVEVKPEGMPQESAVAQLASYIHKLGGGYPRVPDRRQHGWRDSTRGKCR